MKSPLLSLLILSVSSVIAQDYDLNNYKYRFQKYRSAEFDFSFRSNNNYNMHKLSYNDSFIIWNREQKTDVNNLGIYFQLPLIYRKMLNTERLQQNQTLNGNFSYYGEKSYQINSQAQQSELSYVSNNKFYQGSNFTQLDFGVSGKTNGNKNYIDNPYYFRDGSFSR